MMKTSKQSINHVGKQVRLGWACKKMISLSQVNGDNFLETYIFFLSFYDLLLQFTVTDNPLVSYKISKSNTKISIKSLPRKKHWDTELEHIFQILFKVQ
jgi:hypothetical protein